MSERIIDERRFRREHSLNIVDYVVLSEDGEHEDRGMGLTLNVGECGILLETHVPLQQEQILLIHIGIEDDTVDLKGKVTYTATIEESKHRAGVEFMEIDHEGRRVLRSYLKALVYKVKEPEEEKDTVIIPVTESASETEKNSETENESDTKKNSDTKKSTDTKINSFTEKVTTQGKKKKFFKKK